MSVPYQLGAVDAVAVLKFRCETIKYPGQIVETSIYAGDSAIFVDIFRFLFTTFSQPIAAALRAHGYYPPPRWPKDPASREQMIISHAFAGMRAICPSWQPQFDALEFLRERDLVAARITLILDVVKRLIAIHNRVVSTNKANLRARHAHDEQNVVRPSTVEPIVEEDDLPHRNESDESDSTTSRASSGANAPAPPEPKALKTPSRWLATEFFNEDELGLYQDQLQSSLKSLSAMAVAMDAEVACLRSTLKFLDSRKSVRSP